MKKVLSIAIMLLAVMTASAQEQLINGVIEKKRPKGDCPWRTDAAA